MHRVGGGLQPDAPGRSGQKGSEESCEQGHGQGPARTPNVGPIRVFDAHAANSKIEHRGDATTHKYLSDVQPDPKNEPGGKPAT